MSTRSFRKPLHILLVEDNPGDARLTTEAHNEIRGLNSLSVVVDGVDALAFLRRQGRHTNASRPHLILLDLNLPRKTGREVLAEIKSDPEFKRIPVVVLTTSKAEEDVLACYDLHANCYITKPPNLEQFIKVIKVIEEFWISIARLPPE